MGRNTKQSSASEKDLRVQLRIAEADLSFANGGTYPIVGIAVALLAAVAALLPSAKNEERLQGITLLLGVLAMVILTIGFVLIFTRKGRARKVVEAEDLLAKHRAASSPGPAVGLGFDAAILVAVVWAARSSRTRTSKLAGPARRSFCDRED